jgi:hypothetical protein
VTFEGERKIAKHRTARRAAPTTGASLVRPDDECPHCELPYAYEMEARCARCDAVVCPLCVTRKGRSILCPACAAGAR